MTRTQSLRLYIKNMENNEIFKIEKETLKSYESNNARAVIPDEVKVIGDYAFWKNDKIKEIVIPDSVTKIGIGAFFKCFKIEKIYINPQKFHLLADYCDEMLACYEEDTWLPPDDEEPNYVPFSYIDVYSLCVRCWLSESVYSELSEDEINELNTCIKVFKEQYKKLKFDNPEFIYFIMKKKLLPLRAAHQILELCETTECRTMLMEYVNRDISKNSIIDKFSDLGD